jgi:hypothetical protein
LIHPSQQKMKGTVLLFIALSAFLLVEAFEPCTYTPPGSKINYDLSALRLRWGLPYSHKEANGDEWLFNVCDNLSSLMFSNCSKDAVVCKRTKEGLVSNAGKRADWNKLDDSRIGVEVTYGEGDVCGNSRLKTTFEFQCSAADKKLVVQSIKHVDGCYTVITIRSQQACIKPSVTTFATISPGHATIETRFFFSPFLFTMLLGLFLCVCLFCCACCSRRRRQRLHQIHMEHEMSQFPVTTFQVPQNPPAYSAQFVEPQAPQYYLFPTVQSPVVQSPAALEEREGLLSADEKLARELQAQFNQEANM